MDKEVLITIGGFQTAGEEQDKVDVITPGQYYWKNEKHFLVYEETLDDAGHKCSSMVRMSPEEISVRKKGALNSEMVFTTERDTQTRYETPYGTFTLDIHTNRIRIRETDRKIVAMIDYVLSMDGNALSDNYIRIEVVPKSDGVRLH